MAGISANTAWEYLALPEADRAQLPELGREGWELVGFENRAEGATLYLKRRSPSFREVVTLDQRRAYYIAMGRDPEGREGTR